MTIAPFRASLALAATLAALASGARAAEIPAGTPGPLREIAAWRVPASAWSAVLGEAARLHALPEQRRDDVYERELAPRLPRLLGESPGGTEVSWITWINGGRVLGVTGVRVQRCERVRHPEPRTGSARIEETCYVVDRPLEGAARAYVRTW